MRTLVRNAAVLFALAGLGTGCVTNAPSPEERPSKSQTASVQDAVDAARPAPDPHTRGWSEGQWYSYLLQLATKVSFGDGPAVIDFSIDALVQATPISVDATSATLYLALANPKLVSRIPQAQPALDKVAAELAATGCFVRLQGGIVTEMRTPRGLGATAANVYREIGASLQFGRVAPWADDYTTSEYDTTGGYVAEYRSQGNGAWKRKKLRYDSILVPKDAPPNTPSHVVPVVNEAEADIVLAGDGHVQSVVSHSDVGLNGAQQQVHSATSVSLHSGPTSDAKPAARNWAALMAPMVRTAADEPYSVPATVESLDAARIGTMTFEVVTARFEEISRAKQDRLTPSINDVPLASDEEKRQEQIVQEESRLFMALAAILREQPAAVAKAVRKIELHSPAAEVLVGALSSASSAESQRALVTLSNAKTTDEATRNRILLALSRTPRPDPQSIAAMKALLAKDPFSEQGLLGLGSYSRRLRDSGDDREASALGELIVGRLQAAKRKTERLVALEAITNSGYAPALPAVTPYLTDSEELLRSAAVRALQSMRTPGVDGLIADRMHMDSSDDVRISALSAAKVRDPSDQLAQAVESLATSAVAEAHVRYRAVDVLLAWLPRRPDIRGALEHVAQNDAEPRIRARAQTAL